jgi:hypothetical protein
MDREGDEWNEACSTEFVEVPTESRLDGVG